MEGEAGAAEEVKGLVLSVVVLAEIKTATEIDPEFSARKYADFVRTKQFKLIIRTWKRFKNF